MSASSEKTDPLFLPPWLIWPVVVALWCLAAWPFTHGLLMGDSARDVMQGLSVLQGDWPLLGPSIGGVWQLGPLWFYVLAMVLKLTSSIQGTFLLMGVMASAQIPLSYLFGRRLHGRGFGLFLACVTALPGVWVSAATLPTHAALVGSLVCLVGVCLQSAWRAPTVWRMALVGLVCSLACHAHPTALWLAVPVLGLLRHTQKQRGTKQALVALVWMVLAALLPLLPVLWHEWAHGFPQWQASQQYAGKHSLTSALMRWPQDAWAMLNWSRLHLTDAWVADVGFGSMLLHWVWFAGLTTVPLMVFALITGRVNKQWGMPTLCALWAFTFVVLVRSETTVWMLYAVMPVMAWAATEFWWWVLGNRHQIFLIGFTGLLALSVWGMVHGFIQAQTKQGLVSIAAVDMGDVRSKKRHQAKDMWWMGGHRLDVLAQQQCASPDMLLMGKRAQTAVLAQDALRLLHCPHQSPWLLSGGVDAAESGVLYPIKPLPLMPEWRYPPYATEQASRQTVTVSLPNQAGRALVTHRYPFFHPTLAVTHQCGDDERAVARVGGHQWQLAWTQEECGSTNALMIQTNSSDDFDVQWWRQ